jgi:subtilisin family serine protease
MSATTIRRPISPNPDFSGGKLYGTIEGNSFATAFVSGEVAKLMAYDNTLSAADVISRIHKNASGKNLIINLDAAKKNLAARPKVLGASISTKPIVSKKVTLTIR